jgi:hypothetical protein
LKRRKEMGNNRRWGGEGGRREKGRRDEGG